MALFRALWLCLCVFSVANGAKLDGVVTDPSGAAIAGASISCSGPAALSTVTDEHGHFIFENLDDGVWTITAERAGFTPSTLTVNLAVNDSRSIKIELKIAEVQTEVEVTGRRSSLANSDPNYVKLRNEMPAQAYMVENIELQRDAGTLTLRRGQIAFLPPVLDRVAEAVFIGEGRFQMTPVIPMEQLHLQKVIGATSVDEEFTAAVFLFTDDTFDEVKKQARPAEMNPVTATIVRDFRQRVRHQPERPRSMTEAMLTGEDIPNLEADLLAELYNPAQAGSFRAFIAGKRFKDLRYFVIPSGAMPHLPSAEEVGLINLDPVGEHDGIWYLSHRKEEWIKGSANSAENKRVVLAKNYTIETAIGRNNHLTAAANVSFAAVIGGARVIRFGLLPALRVTRVTMNSREVSFIQEPRRQDGSFYVIMPEPMQKDGVYSLHIEYEGDRVISSEGSGNFSVGARTSWYPSLNTFLDRATYDLTFKVPKSYIVASIGKLVKESKEQDFDVSEWKSDVPLAVAGFNYGLFKKKRVTDSETKYEIEAYATDEVPDYLREAAEKQSLTPARMADSALIDGQNSIRVFEHWFGPCPYGRIAITQQPDPNFGQSWPSLVYLPLFAFFDSTQRWMLMGEHAFRYAGFIQEVTPHEIAHQWWGHMVGWASYRDQWLSEGFAEFSAGLFLETTEKQPEVDRFWNRLHDEIVQKNSFGVSPDEAGPIWMGIRLDTHKTEGAYNRLIYPKGAYILQMLRMLMHDDKTGDQDFSDMMKDFVKFHMNQNATTESFKSVAERHMKPVLDMEGNHKLDWFFRDWVYGTDLPRYKLEYSITNEGGKAHFTGKMTQSDVSPGFMMRVPIYFEIDGHLVRAGYVALHGNMTSTDLKLVLPKKPKKVMIAPMHDVLASEIAIKEI